MLSIIFLAASTTTNTQGGTPNWVPFVVIPIIVLIIIGFRKLGKKRKANQLLQQQQKTEVLAGFFVSKEVSVARSFGSEKLLIDDTNKKFAIVDNYGAKVFNYADLLDFELDENGINVTKGSFLKTAVGGAAFGLVGALAGAASSKTSQVCTSMTLRIIINDLQNPQILLYLLSGKHNANSFTYTSAKNIANEAIASLTYIMNNK